MNLADIVIIAGVALAVFLALRRMYRMKKSGCSCGCSECGRNSAGERRG